MNRPTRTTLMLMLFAAGVGAAAARADMAEELTYVPAASLAAQGGSAAGCGVPAEAAALAVTVRVAKAAGAGPPQGLGWVRTGSTSNAITNSPGESNCEAWSQTSGFGTAVRLSFSWTSPATEVSPWQAQATTFCNSNLGVWCVED